MNADHQPVIITRDPGKPAAVLMSLDDFTAYEETHYLLKNPRNAERLLQATQALDQGRGSACELTD